MRRLLVFFFIVVVASSCSTLGIVMTGGGPPPKSEEGSGGTYPSYRTLNIPPGHLPPPGKCRVWIPGKPPGQQGPPVSCEVALRDAAPGTWVLYRNPNKSEVLEVKEKKKVQARVEIVIKKYTIN